MIDKYEMLRWIIKDIKKVGLLARGNCIRFRVESKVGKILNKY